MDNKEFKIFTKILKKGEFLIKYPDYVLDDYIFDRFKFFIFKKALEEYKKGKILFEKNEYIGAANKFQKAIDLDSYYIDAYCELGRSLFVLGDYNGAVKKFKKCTELDPNNVDAYHYWGHSLEDMEDCEGASKKFGKCTEIDDDDIGNWTCWANLLFVIGHYDEAIEKFERCIKIDPRYGYAYRRIGDILWTQGRYGDARKEWKRAKDIYEGKIQDAINDEDTRFFSDFGELLCCGLDELDKAENIYKKGLGLNEDNIDILLGLVHLYIGHNKDNSEINRHCGRIIFRKAEKLLTDELSKKEDANLYFQLGQLFLDAGEYEDAQSNLTKAFDKDKESADICLCIGILYFDNEEFKKAIKYFKLALERDSDSLIIKRNLADTYLEEKLFNDAKTEYEDILDIAPYNVESLIGLGKIYTNIGDDSENGEIYEDAIIQFDKVIDMTKSEQEQEKVSTKLKKKELAEIYYSRGYAKVKLDLLSDAMKDFKDCLENDPSNDMAKRSKRKIEKEMGIFIQKIGIFIPNKLEKICEGTVFILSMSMFFVSWYLYFEKLLDMNINYLAIFSFVSLILVSISPFLRYISKVKAPGGIEIEKSPFVPIAHNKIGIEKPIHR